MGGRYRLPHPIPWAALMLAVGFAFGAETWFLKLLYPFPFRAGVERAAADAGLDPYLVAAVAKVESGFNPRAVSPKGARGLMQVMPDTGAWVARQIGWERYHPDLLFEPEISLRIGAWYLAHLRRAFDGRLVPALAAYNAGRGNVGRWLASGLWDGSLERARDIPFLETRVYVQRVTKAYRRYRQLYGNREDQLSP